MNIPCMICGEFNCCKLHDLKLPIARFLPDSPVDTPEKKEESKTICAKCAGRGYYKIGGENWRCECQIFYPQKHISKVEVKKEPEWKFTERHGNGRWLVCNNEETIALGKIDGNFLIQEEESGWYIDDSIIPKGYKTTKEAEQTCKKLINKFLNHGKRTTK